MNEPTAPTTNDFHFRPALTSDSSEMAGISGQLESFDNPSGYLPSSLTQAEFQVTIASYVVAVDAARQTVAGYVRTDPAEDAESMESLDWVSEEARLKFRNARTHYIGQIAVAPGSMGRGVGRFMYETLSALNPHTALYSYILLTPVANHASESFHAAVGFTPIATHTSEDMFRGFNGYSSRLWFRSATTQ